MEISHDSQSIQLTSSEIGYLWTTYILQSKCKMTVIAVMDTIHDKDVNSVMQLSVELSDKSINSIKGIFKDAGQAIPAGFSEMDINKRAPKLYSDFLLLKLLKVYSEFGLSNYSLALSSSARSDVKQFFTDSLISAIDLLNKIDDVLLNKGLFDRTPFIQPHNKVEFADKQSIKGSWFGRKRPLNAIEISHLYRISLIASYGEALLTGFSQTAADNIVRDYAHEGRQLIKEQRQDINELLEMEELKAPPCLVEEVLYSKESPFLDRLLHYFTITMCEDILAACAIGKVNTLRKDIALLLTQLSGELTLFIKEGIDIMIEKKWYEEIPKNIDRSDAIKANK